MHLVCAALLASLAACGLSVPLPVHPTYEFEALYAPAVATPPGIKADLAAYASQVCGDRYAVLSQLFVGEAGPSYVRIRFACS